jgi:hypothetical protein
MGGRGVVYTGFWGGGGGAEGRNHFEDLGVNGRIMLK